MKGIRGAVNIAITGTGANISKVNAMRKLKLFILIIVKQNIPARLAGGQLAVVRVGAGGGGHQPGGGQQRPWSRGHSGELTDQ